MAALDYACIAYQQQQPLCMQPLFTIDNRETDVQCYIRRSRDRLIITFRGSNSSKDWRTNLTFWKKTIPYDNTSSKIRVHTGFINAYKRLASATRCTPLWTTASATSPSPDTRWARRSLFWCAVEFAVQFSGKGLRSVSVRLSARWQPRVSEIVQQSRIQDDAGGKRKRYCHKSPARDSGLPACRNSYPYRSAAYSAVRLAGRSQTAAILPKPVFASEAVVKKMTAKVRPAAVVGILYYNK